MDFNINVELFFSALSSKLETAKEVRAEYNKTNANDFNIFNDFFCLGENKTSKILAFFLNPNQTHGQGNLFLKLFLTEIVLKKLPENKKEKISVNHLLSRNNIKTICEYVIENNRRIDIFVEFGDDFAVAIENKIWAKDQPDQLKDYDDYLGSIYEKDKYILFYLNPYQEYPSEISIDKENLKRGLETGNIIIIDYQDDIITLAELWRNNCQAEKVRNFLNDFIRFLDQEINGINIKNNNMETIVNFVVDKEEYIRIALEISKAIGDVKEKLYEEFQKVLNSKTRKYQILEDIKTHGEYGKKESGFYFKFRSGKMKDFSIRFEFDGDGFQYLAYGICRVEGTNKDFDNKISELFEEGFATSEMWPRYIHLYKEGNIYKWNDETFAMIKSEEMYNVFLQKIEFILDKVKNI